MIHGQILSAGAWIVMPRVHCPGRCTSSSPGHDFLSSLPVAPQRRYKGRSSTASIRTPDPMALPTATSALFQPFVVGEGFPSIPTYAGQYSRFGTVLPEVFSFDQFF